MRGLIGRLRAKSEARQMWCAFCRERPRVTLPDGEDRYCSEFCADQDAENQAIR